MEHSDLVKRIVAFVTDELITTNVETPDVVTALVESAGLVIGTTNRSMATSEGNYLFNLLCDHLAAAIAHYAAGGTADHDEWLDGEDDDETRFRDPRSIRRYAA